MRVKRGGKCKVTHARWSSNSMFIFVWVCLKEGWEGQQGDRSYVGFKQHDHLPFLGREQSIPLQRSLRPLITVLFSRNRCLVVLLLLFLPLSSFRDCTKAKGYEWRGEGKGGYEERGDRRQTKLNHCLHFRFPGWVRDETSQELKENPLPH